ncbi:hypothetical protein ACXKTX_20455 [Burkholderia gladioli]
MELLHNKKWVSLAEAAQQLSEAFGAKVTESDVLQFSLDGWLKIGVNLVANPRTPSDVWEAVDAVSSQLDTLGGELERQRSAFHAKSHFRKISGSRRASPFMKGGREKEKLKSELLAHGRLLQRANTFIAFVSMVESKGVVSPLNENEFSRVVCDSRWDEISPDLAKLIRSDVDVKNAFKTFEDSARNCYAISRTQTRAGRLLGPAAIAGMYQAAFLNATTVYVRKMGALEASLDKLSTLSLSELESLVSDGDDLSRRVADLSLRIVSEIKRREAKKGAEAKDEKFEPIRQFALNLAESGAYPSRRQAVLAIKEQVLTYATSLGVSMSVQQSDKTIDGWLKDLGYTPSAGKRGTSTS